MEVSKLKFALLVAMVIYVKASNAPQGVEEQKNYYSPDPHHSTPSVPTTPTYGNPTPSHHGGGHRGGSGSNNCGTPPTHHGGGGHRGGGSYYHSPPSTPTPTFPVTPTPTNPVTPTPVPVTPTPPVDPGTPYTPTPSNPPLLPAPTAPPYDPGHIPPVITGTCNFWRTHPYLIWGIFGYWGTVGPVFGLAATPAFTPGLSLLQALANTRPDGYGALYREGTAALLNSMATTNFGYSTQQVKDRFVSSMVSDKAAAAQAGLFKQANEEKLKLNKP